MRLLIGGPVLRREWIIGSWFYHVFQSVKRLEETPEIAFVFIGGEGDPTFDTVQDICQDGALKAYVDYVDEPREEDIRSWEDPRLHRMVYLRNRLLESVRRLAPDFFLSLDSDVLLHPDCLRNLIESSQGFDVVGGRCYMTRWTDAPSNMVFGKMVPTRHDVDYVVPVDVVMACKLMQPQAYQIDYKYDFRGEDLGIARNWKEAGLKVGYDGRVGNKHILDRENLNKFDERVGW